MRLGRCCAILLLGILADGCSSGHRVTVMITPATVTLNLQAAVQFSATVTGQTDQTVTWSVNDIAGGNATLGIISTNGLYTAPAALPPPANGSTTSTVSVTIKAVSTVTTSASATATVTLNSGVAITIAPTTPTVGTSEVLTFTATVTGSTTLTANWLVNNVSGGNSTTGTITPTGVTAVYTAPATLPTTATVTITAQATADTTKSAAATLTLVTPSNPTLTAVSPSQVPQGAFFQDLYLTGSNFLSTSTVLLGGNPIPSTLLSSTLLRARAPANLLNSQATLSLVVQRQNLFTTAALSVGVLPQRPALVTTLPESASQSAGTVTFEFDGGFFPTTVNGEFSGQPKPTTPIDPRRLQVTLGSTDLTTPGLFAVGVRNPVSTPPRSAVNLAVQASPTSVLPGVTNIIPGFNQPSSVAINTATGVAVVANTGGNSIALVSLTTNLITNPAILVGTSPTSVAVDNERNLAVVADNGSNDVAVVDLGTLAVSMVTGVGTAPFAVGVDPIQGLALVANQSTNTASILDLKTVPPSVVGTVAISTGANPQVTVLPQLGWAIVTPGGAGAISVVDLGRRSVVYTANLGLGVRGVAVNTETHRLLLTDPTSTSVILFSLLDQGTPALTLEAGHVAAAINPLTNTGVSINPNLNQASVIDLLTPQRVATFNVGMNPRAVAIDPGTNTALVANQGDNTVSVIGLGPIRSTAVPPNDGPQIVQMNPPLTFTSGNPLTLSIIGEGFVSGCAVRFDESSSLITTTFVSSRHLTATVDPTTYLSAPRRFVVDVVNPGSKPSNVENLVVIEAVPVGANPQAVAIDPDLDMAVVVNTGSNSISLVNMTTGSVTATISLGANANPQAVAVLPRAGRAVVTNGGIGTASIVDLVGATILATVSVGSQPVGVTIDADSGNALVTNSASNTLSVFSVTGAGTPTVVTIAVDAKPVAVAVAPELHFAAVAHAVSNNLMILDTTGPTPVILRRATGFQVPTGVVYDPVTQVFLAVSSLTNNLVVVNPVTGGSLPACPMNLPCHIGINPTSLAYNFQTSTLLTVNTASNTISVFDFPNRGVRAFLGLAAGPQFSADIHPRTNLAAIVDQANNRLLLVPMPR